MISTMFLYIIYGLVYGLTSPLRLLEDVTLNTSLSSAAINAYNYINTIVDLFPTLTLITVFLIYIAVHNYMSIYKFIQFILRRIPTQS